MNNDNMKASNNLILVTSILLCSLCASQTYAAIKGKAGTVTRSTWCEIKLSSCIGDANSTCDETWPGTSVQDTNGRSLCKSSEVATCKNSYGSTSDCMTRDLVSRDSILIKTAGDQKVIEVPGTSTPTGAGATIKPLRDRVLLAPKIAPVKKPARTPIPGQLIVTPYKNKISGKEIRKPALIEKNSKRLTTPKIKSTVIAPSNKIKNQSNSVWCGSGPIKLPPGCIEKPKTQNLDLNKMKAK